MIISQECAGSGIRHTPDEAWAVKDCYEQGTSRTERFHHWEAEG